MTLHSRLIQLYATNHYDYVPSAFEVLEVSSQKEQTERQSDR